MLQEIDIFSCFFPSQEITDPRFFAGRMPQFDIALRALSSPGSSMIVFGDRGVGKSSFVSMIKNIVGGDHYLLYKHELHKRYNLGSIKFHTIFTECNESMETTEKVLSSLITSPNGIKKFIKGRIESFESSKKVGFSISKIFSDLLGFNYEGEDKQVSTGFKPETITQDFIDLVMEVEKSLLLPGEGLLIIIDEFDLLKDNSGFASIIKNLSKNRVKFLISGIAESYDQLISSHRSIERTLFNGRINIAPMKKDELEEIFELIHVRYNKRINFNSKFIEAVFNLSHGFPYYAQILGQLSTNAALISQKSKQVITVNTQHLNLAQQELVKFEPNLDNLYLSVIGSNPEKELLLKTLSSQIPSNILHKDVLINCAKKQVANPQSVLNSILAQRDPQVLRKINIDSVTFINPLFKIYSNSRTPEYIKALPDGFYLPSSMPHDPTAAS